MSIRLKMVISIVIVFILGGVSVGLFMRQSYQTSVSAEAVRAVAVDQAAFKELEAADTLRLSAINLALQQNDTYRQAFLAKDRDKLAQLTSGVFGSLRGEYDMTHWYFEDQEPTSTVFLRVHKPEQFGDVLKRKTYLAASKDQTTSAGLELGATAVALRVVRPYYDTDGKTLIGYMETGQEIDSFLHSIQAQTGDVVGLLLSKSSMDSSSWAATRENQGLPDNWDDQKDYVLAGSTNPEFDDEMVIDKPLDSIDAKGELLREYEEGSRLKIHAAFPMFDVEGDRIGAVWIEHDVTHLAGDLARSQMIVGGAVLAMLAVVMAIVIALMNRLIFGRLDSMIAHMQTVSTRVAGGDFEVEFKASGSTDEIGRFEDFFGKFITLVGQALKALSER